MYSRLPALATSTVGKGRSDRRSTGQRSPESLRQALRTGAVNRVPIIAGTDRGENVVGLPTTAAQYTQLVHTQYPSMAARAHAVPRLAFHLPVHRLADPRG
jgi:hypothetical protein